MKTDYTAGIIGTSMGIIGTATQVNDVLQTISLIITIIGALISFIVVPLVNWHRSAKKDGKITSDEVKEGCEILKDGLDKTNEIIERTKQNEQSQSGEDQGGR